MKSEEFHEEFWQVVVDCLAAFHKWRRDKAKRAVEAYRSELASKVNKSTFSMIYHEEPFIIACEVADNALDISTHRQRYESILDRHKW